MKIFLFFSLLINLILSKSLSTTAWSADLLYENISSKINKNEEVVEYIVIDPDNRLNTTVKNEIYNKMIELNNRNSNNLINYIMIINKINETEKNDLGNLLDNFSSKMKDIFEKYGHTENDTLISAFAIDTKQLKIKIGENIKIYLTDYKVKKILQNREDDIKNNNYDKIMEGLMNDIYNYYGNGSTFLFWSIFISIMSFPFCVIIFVAIFDKCSKNSNNDLSDSFDYKVKDNGEEGKRGEEDMKLSSINNLKN